MANKNIKIQLECPYTHSTVEKAFGQEVNLFMHCHMRGYDKDGEGKQLCSDYYDKYGAPVNLLDSWVEGYHAVEQLLAKHFNTCDNEMLDFPLIAGAAGGVHLYKDLHNDKPYNWTGWVPLQRKWLCEGKFFSNRYFLTIRGNEVQNNLWDYHPHEEDEGAIVDDMEYSQVEPNDAYRGGYFFKDDPFGRYLHVMTIKQHNNDPATGRPKRYNYIVHPLAYRSSLDNIPDNGVDAMQWCIINIAKEDNFGRGKPWGEKCHGLEIFNDFTLANSYAAGSEPCYNGTLIPGEYRYWFDTYPLEYAEFLLDSALTRGVYLHTLTNNDAFYKKLTRYDPDGNNDHEELMRNHMSDPKGGVNVAQLKMSKDAHHKPAATKTEKYMDEYHAGKDGMKEIKEFLSTLPYGFETVFGYTALIDTEQRLRKAIFERKVPGAGIDDAEIYALQYLLEGNFFASLGIHDLFDYSAKDQFIPYVITGQPNPKRMANYLDDKMALEFTFEKLKNQKNERLVWRYTVMSETETNTLQSAHGYFKLSLDKKTVLDLSAAYNMQKVKWLYFIAIDPINPMKRAWFNAVMGPAFGEPRVDAFVLPDLQHKVFSTKCKRSGKIVQGDQLPPMEVKSGNLDFMFPACLSEKEDICVYFLQVCPLLQDITLEKKTDTSSKKRPPRILQSVHGLFLMHPDHPTRLKLSNSWDKEKVKNSKVYFYEVNASSGCPQEVNPKPAVYRETMVKHNK